MYVLFRNYMRDRAPEGWDGGQLLLDATHHKTVRKSNMCCHVLIDDHTHPEFVGIYHKIAKQTTSTVGYSRQCLLSHTTDTADNACCVTQQLAWPLMGPDNVGSHAWPCNTAGYSRQCLLSHTTDTADDACCVRQQPMFAASQSRHCLLCDTADQTCKQGGVMKANQPPGGVDGWLIFIPQ